MRIYHIYTDASCKNTKLIDPITGVERTVKVGIIVVNSHILDIYYKKKEKFTNSNQAEKQAIIESIRYVKSKYNAKSIIIHTDAFFTIKFSRKEKKYLENVKILYVRGHHPERKNLKHKFNCLADWISRNGILTWRNYYYRHLL